MEIAQRAHTVAMEDKDRLIRDVEAQRAYFATLEGYLRKASTALDVRMIEHDQAVAKFNFPEVADLEGDDDDDDGDDEVA